ncbi:Chaperone SurA [Thalassocella blandensis]|nr:Chaperone SurA [Thalassocella blandensis]
MNLRRYLPFALLLSSLFSSISAQAQIEMMDRVIAVVDEEVITQTELDSRIQDIAMRANAAGMQLPPESVLREQILDQLINETLQLNAAHRYGVTVSDQEVLQAIGNIMANKGINEQQLVQSLQQDGVSIEEFKSTIHKQLLMQNISQGLVRSRIKISEQDIDNFLVSADAKFWLSPEYNLSHILIALPSAADGKTIAAAEEKAEKIYAQLQKGAKFEDLALAESDGPNALQGGNLGWRKSTDLPSLFAEIAPKLENGEVAKPARSQAGFHILKLNAKRGETKQIVNQTLPRHILLETSAIRDDEQAKAKLLELRKEVLDGADFGKLAKQWSDDIGSKLQGGELGWSSPGKFVPIFEKTMEDMEINEISQPFKSQFGWHILQIMDRRAEDLTEQAIRARAQNVLMSRRFEDEVQLWIQEMRDNAYIDIKI